MEEFAYCALGVVWPCESHEIRPRDCTSHGRLLMVKEEGLIIEIVSRGKEREKEEVSVQYVFNSY